VQIFKNIKIIKTMDPDLTVSIFFHRKLASNYSNPLLKNSSNRYFFKRNHEEPIHKTYEEDLI